jgi:four helix bundle protein
VTGTVFKTVCEAVRAVLGRFDSDTPPPIQFRIWDLGFFRPENKFMTQEEMKARTKRLALRVIKLVQSLPPNLAAEVIGKQLLRSGTSVGANYRASCRAKSPADFINKLSIVEEEADESVYWTELLIEGKIVKENLLENLMDEGNQILSIVVSSIKTLKEKRNPKSEFPNPKSL